MSKEKDNKEILNEVILGYRRVIAERYDYKNLKKRSDLPKSYNEERATIFKDYFLNYTYPLPDKRKSLNEAFLSLDNYIKHPNKLLQIVLDSSSILIKYGRYLPKIFNAGIKALRAFRKASRFEKNLVEHAIFLNLKIPYSNHDIDKLIKTLPREEIEDYIKSMRNLFEILRDSVLVSKIKNVISHLIKMMKKKPNVYSEVEIKGLEIGYDIIVAGDLLFSLLSKDDQLEIFNFIIKLEREVLDKTFSEE